MASYQGFNVNQPYGTALPRPAQLFTQGSFGPLSPVAPMPIDQTAPGGDRPDPRRFQYPVGWNLPVGQPGSEGIKLATFATLRAVADMFSVARTCVDKRISEIVGMEWDIVPTKEAEHAMRGEDSKRADWEKRRLQVLEFFDHPDSDRAKFPTWGTWMTAMLEDLFVLDAVALHLRPAKGRNGGPFNKGLAAVDVLDGSTIRPLLDMHGSTPAAPNVAYQQYIWGVPRVDLTSVMLGVDIEGLEQGLVQEYRSDQLLYLRQKPRNWTPYGFSPVEEALLPIMIGLARQQYQWDYFQDGSIPGQFVVPGPDIATPTQIKQLQDALNAMAGDVGAKHRIIVLPPGSKADPQKPPPLADQFDEWVISQVTMPFMLTPFDLGVTPRVSAIQSPAESKQIQNVNSSAGQSSRVEPITSWLKQVLFDYVIQGIFGQEDMEWSWGVTEGGEGGENEVQLHVTQAQNGLESIDEARVEMGKTPWGLPETSVPLVFTPTGPVPLTAAVAQAEANAQNAQTMANASAQGMNPLQQAGAMKPGQQKPGLPGKPGQPGQQNRALGERGVDEHGEPTTPAHEAQAAAAGGKQIPSSGASGAGDVDEAGQQAAKKALAAELEILARHLRKGRPIEAFRSDLIPGDLLVGADLTKSVSDVVASIGHKARRAIALGALVVDVAKTLGDISYRYRNGSVSFPSAVDEAMAVMKAGYRAAMNQGSRHAADDHNVIQVDFAGRAEKRAAQQGMFVSKMLTKTPDPAELTARLDLYGATLNGAYNEAYGDTIHADQDHDYDIVWRLGHTEHCDKCVGRDGKSFTFDDLPGWPGDGGFGELCEGGPNCGCHLEFVQKAVVLTGVNTQRPDSVAYYAEQNAVIGAERRQAKASRAAFLDSIPGDAAARAAARDSARDQLAEVANQAIRAAGGYGGISVEPMDVPASMVRDYVNSTQPDWVEREFVDMVTGTSVVAKGKPVTVSGLAVHAKDTGRVLMLQRALGGDDPAAGKWEFPGGHIDRGEGEMSLGGAHREFQEETGLDVPAGKAAGSYTSSNGVYELHRHDVEHEDDVPIHTGRDGHDNPDDPHGDHIESIAWMDPSHLVENPAVRDELQADMPKLLDLLGVDKVEAYLIAVLVKVEVVQVCDSPEQAQHLVGTLYDEAEYEARGRVIVVKTWDPAHHPRGPHGRFISTGGAHLTQDWGSVSNPPLAGFGHPRVASGAREMAPSQGLQPLQAERPEKPSGPGAGRYNDILSAMGFVPFASPTARAGEDISAEMSTEHMQAHEASERDKRVRLLADAARRNRNYTDEQINRAAAALNQTQAEAEREDAHRAKVKLAFDALTILGGLAIAIFATPVLALAPVAVAELIRVSPDVAHAAVEWKNRL